MTELEVINRALSMLGVEPLRALSIDNKASRLTRQMLPGIKKTVLIEYPWTFALRTKPLALIPGLSVAGYQRVFCYPADALCVRRVYTDAAYCNTCAEFRTLEIGIASNVSVGMVEYVAMVDDIQQWPDPVAECLAVRLASEGAMSLAGSMQMSMSLLEKYVALAGIAARASAIEECVRTPYATDYMDARR